MKYTKHHSTNTTPQSQPIPNKDMVANNANGFVFALDPFKAMQRFLMLGTEGGTYYVSESKLTQEAAQNTIHCIKTNGLKTVGEVVVITEDGRAPKTSPAIFVLALCMTYGDAATKAAAYTAIRIVCRTGTHLFELCQYIQDLRGWSRGLRTAVGNWYLKMPVDKLAYQLIKYRQRDGWTHKDVLRLCHAKPNSDYKPLLEFAVKNVEVDVPIIKAFFEVHNPVTGGGHWVNAVKKYNLPREALPTEALNKLDVWDALNDKMPITATIRNLGKMTSIGLLQSKLDENTKKVIARITNQEQLIKGRVHPLAIITALKTYAQGHGDKGKLSWNPIQGIVDALDEAFYLAFKAVIPTGKNFLLGLDVSGSMGGSKIAGSPLTPRDACAVMAMVTSRVEPNTEMLAFTHVVVPFTIGVKDRLDTVVKKMEGMSFGATDCAQPMVWARDKNIPVDCFVVYTDSETWCGGIHPVQALNEYRAKRGKLYAKSVVVAMTASKFTIADPNDAGMLDVVGFDTATPQVISQFAGE